MSCSDCINYTQSALQLFHKFAPPGGGDPLPPLHVALGRRRCGNVNRGLRVLRAGDLPPTPANPSGRLDS